MSNLLPISTTGDQTLDTFEDGSLTKTIEFVAGDLEHTVNMSLPANATVISASMDVIGQPTFVNQDLFHQGLDFDSASVKTNVDISSRGVSLRTDTVEWYQDEDDEFLTNALQDLHVDSGVKVNLTLGPPGADTETVGLWNMDENGGTVFGDNSTIGNGGNFAGGNPQWAVGRFGPGIQFDGVDDMATIPYNSAYQGPSITYDFWMKTSDPTGTMVTRKEGSVYMYRAQVLNGKFKSTLELNPGTSTITGQMNVNDGEWHHMATTFNDGVHAIYVDGHLDTYQRETGNESLTTAHIYLGAEPSLADPFSGIMDAFRISTPMRIDLFNHSEAIGSMTSQAIPWSGSPHLGNLRVNITTPFNTGYFVSVLDGDGLTMVTQLMNGDRIEIPADQDAIKMQITMWATNVSETPVLHSWGFGTTIADYSNDLLRHDNVMNIRNVDGEFMLYSDPEPDSLTRYSSNPVMAGVYISAPSVLRVGDTYHMYYNDYLTTEQIYHATSTDGIAWSPDVSNPVLRIGNSGAWDETTVKNPCVVKVGNTYYMYFTGISGSVYGIGLATSNDGSSWAKASGNPLLLVGEAGDFDSDVVDDPWVIRDGDIFRMYYSGNMAAGQNRIGIATSIDGYVWKKYGYSPVISEGATGFDTGHAEGPSVVKVGDTYHMYYAGYDGINWQIGYAYSSDGLIWTKGSKNPVLPMGSFATWDSTHVSDPGVIFDEGVFKVYYLGRSSLIPLVQSFGLARTEVPGLGSYRTKPFQLGISPLSFTNLTIETTTPQSTDIEVSVATATTISGLSNFVSIDDHQDLSGISPKDYVQFEVKLTSTDVHATPRISTLQVGYDSSGEDGVLISQTYPTDSDISKVLANYTSDPVDREMTLSVSTDDGSTWKETVKGAEVVVDPGKSITYKMDLSGSMFTTGKVFFDNLSIDYFMERDPSDVKVDIGGDGVDDLVHEGDLVGNVTIPAENITTALNDYLELHRGDAGPGGNISIPVVVRSMTPGYVTLDRMDITYIIRPRVIDHSPIGQDVNQTTPSIWARFNTEITSDAITSDILVKESGGMTVSGKVSIVEDRIEFVPVSALRYDTLYNITVNTTVTTLVDSYDHRYQWEFRTSPQPIEPWVDILGHGPFGSNVNISTTVWIDFSQPMDESTVRGNINIIRGGTDLAVSYDFLNGSRSVVITPNAPLWHSTEYTVEIDLAAVKDEFGNPVATPSWVTGDHFLDGEDWGWNFTTEKGPAVLLKFDLKVVSITPEKDPIIKGEGTKITIAVLLTGDQIPDIVKLHMQVTGDRLFTRGLNLTVDEVETTSFQIMSHAESVELTVTIDPEDLLAETDETNNILTQTFSVSSGNGPPPPPNGGDDSIVKILLDNWFILVLLMAILAAIILGLVVRSRRSKRPDEVLDKDLEEEVARTAPATGTQAQASTPPPPPPTAPVKPVVEDFDVDAVFFVRNDGRLLASEARKKARVDDDLMSGMLTAVRDFVKETFQAEDGLDSFTFGGRKVLLAVGQHSFVTVAISGKEPPGLKDEVQGLEERLEAHYAGVVEEWDGNLDAFPDVQSFLVPLFTYKDNFRIKDMVKVKSGLEFYRGYVRLKVGVSNNCQDTIDDVKLSINFDNYALRLVKIEPQRPMDGQVVDLGSIDKGKKSTVAYYLDPLICQESDVTGQVSYTNSAGERQTVEMKARPVDVVCPLFYTTETINIAMLKRLVDELRNKDSKWFRVIDPQWLRWVYEETCNEVGAHDVKLVRSYTEGEDSPGQFIGESWYYGETSEVVEKLAIMVQVQECNSTLQVMVATDNLASQIGLLAELGNKLQERMQGYIEPIFEEITEDALCKIQYLLDKYGPKEG